MLDPRRKIRFFHLYFLIGILSAVSGCERIRDQISKQNEPEKPPAASPLQGKHLFFGNPSDANASDPDNYLIVGNGSVISYSSSRGTANWISWKTSREDLGPTLPRPEFRPDPRLPASFDAVISSDYSGSGYDRGHLVPSADRFGDAALNEETFMMTNIVPQTGALNQYPWQKFEKFVRGQARRGLDVYQIAGVYGSKERLKGRVAVPTNCWKIIVVMPKGRDDIGERVRLIAVNMPNDYGIEQGGWERFRTSVRAIEKETGYDFFGSLTRETQDHIETLVEMDSR